MSLEQGVYTSLQDPRSEKELHQAVLELMKKKHRDMGLIEDVIR